MYIFLHMHIYTHINEDIFAYFQPIPTNQRSARRTIELEDLVVFHIGCLALFNN